MSAAAAGFSPDLDHDRSSLPENFRSKSKHYRSIAFRGALISNSAMPKLTFRSETGESTSHDLVEESYTIGRSPDNSIRLDDGSVSGRHAELTLVAENCYLKDLGSTNGTLVNGQPVTDVQLRAGDRVRFGKIEAVFEGEVAGGAQPLPHLQEVEARPAELSARPVDFANASPFPSRKKTKDPARVGILAAVVLAFAAFVVSMIALFLMRPPGL
jgi:hypothetical protein